MPSLAGEDTDRYRRAWIALEGLSVGDAFGEGFFTDADSIEEMLETRTAPVPVWRYTDDTQMTLSIMSVLRQQGAIEQELLAASFAERYEYERGYGPSLRPWPRV
jgi:ADP-ribosylglycohydrolase